MEAEGLKQNQEAETQELKYKDNIESKASSKYSYQKGKAKKPKRNKSAFILFSIEMRAKLKTDFKDQLNSNEMMVKLATLWKDLSKSERERYYTEAKDDKARYLRELDNFSKAYPKESIHNKTKKNHIKKPCSAYAIFLKDMKSVIKTENSDLKMADVLKIVSEKWKNLKEEEKNSYKERADLEKELARNKLGDNKGKLSSKISPVKACLNSQKKVKTQDQSLNITQEDNDITLNLVKVEDPSDQTKIEDQSELLVKLETNNISNSSIQSFRSESTTISSNSHDSQDQKVLCLFEENFKKMNKLLVDLHSYYSSMERMENSNFFSSNNLGTTFPLLSHFPLTNDCFAPKSLATIPPRQIYNNTILNLMKAETSGELIKEEAEHPTHEFADLLTSSLDK